MVEGRAVTFPPLEAEIDGIGEVRVGGVCVAAAIHEGGGPDGEKLAEHITDEVSSF